jgi:signal transduction histidine kinase
MISRGTISLSWNWYRNYVRKIVLPYNGPDVNDIEYWRNEIFLAIVSFLAPVSIIALVPSVIMSFLNNIPVLGVADLVSFGLVILILANRRLPLWRRKVIFILIFYVLSVILLYYLAKPGPGLLFLLTSTMLSSVIYSAAVGFYSAWMNVFICICFGFCILLRINMPLVADYNLPTWMTISCTVAFISFVCAECLSMLLKGLKSSLDESKKLAASLTAIIENTDAIIFSLDMDFRYVIINQVLKNNVQKAYNVEIKPGDIAFEFLEKLFQDEAKFWKTTFSSAANGQAVRFEKDYNIGGQPGSAAFSINAIIENGRVTGLSCFVADITERKNAQREIQELNDELEIKVAERTAQLAAINKELEAFSYSVSHDLRAPLRAINGYANMFKEDYGAGLEPEAGRIINNITDYAKKMGQLIDDLLAFSRLGRKELVKAPVSMQDIVENICFELEGERDGHSVKFTINQLAPACGDSFAIRQVWANLISNAVKYSTRKEKAIIEIGSQITGNEAVYYIKDNGAGFDMRYADKLFGVFQRLHSEEEFEGNGVGLAIVHRIVSKHGGRIWAEAKVNEGAIFYFTLT